jgi:hypothetical protein
MTDIDLCGLAAGGSRAWRRIESYFGTHLH